MLTRQAPFEALTYRAQVARLRRLALRAAEAFGLEPKRMRLLGHGENTTYRVLDHDGQGYMLRIHRAGYQSGPGILEELSWLSALRRQTALRVPEPVASLTGELLTTIAVEGVPEPRHCALFRWLPLRFRYWSLGPKAVGQVAEATGLLQRYVLERGGLPASHRRRWDTEGLLGATAHWGDVAAIEGFVPKERTQVLEVRTRLVGLLQEAEADPANLGLIHADLHEGNYGFEGQRVTFIDFDDCGQGFWLYDPAVTLFALRQHPRFPALQKAYLETYAAYRPLGERETKLLEALMMARVMSGCAWVHTRSDNPQVARHAKSARAWVVSAAERYLKTGSCLGA